MLNPSSGDITGTVAVNDAAYGAYTVTVIATNGSASASETFTWTVSSPVSIDSIAAQSYTEGGSVSLTPSVTYTGDGTPVFAGVGLPTGLMVNTSTGEITGTVALGNAADGPFTVTVIGNDGTYSTSQAFTINVGGEIAIARITAQTNYELDTVSVSVSAMDSSMGTLTYSAVGLPAGLSINTTTGAIAGTVADGASAYGPYNVVVTVSDGTYSASQSLTWNVNDPITIQSVATQDWSVGQTVNLQLQASDTIPDATLHYVATGLPAGLSINPTTGDITGTISNVLSNVGAFSVTVTVSDGESSQQSALGMRIRCTSLGLDTTNFFVAAATDEKPAVVPQLSAKLVDWKKAKDLPYSKRYFDIGSDAKWTTLTVKDPKVLVQVAAGKNEFGLFYVFRYFIAIEFTARDFAGFSLIQSVAITTEDGDNDGNVVPDSVHGPEGLIEGWAIPRDGIVLDPTGLRMTIYQHAKDPQQRKFRGSTAAIGLFDRQNVPSEGDQPHSLGVLNNEVNNMTSVAPGSMQVQITVDFIINRNGAWSLTSPELGIKEKGALRN